MKETISSISVIWLARSSTAVAVSVIRASNWSSSPIASSAASLPDWLRAAASCAVERYETYRHMVAMPASVGIALIGAYWVVERVFL